MVTGFDYTNLLNYTVSPLIRRYGGLFSYTAVVRGTYDPATRTQAGIDTTITISGAFMGPGKTFIDGTIIERGEARLLLNPKNLTITPKQGDRINTGGVYYFVESVQVIDPSGAEIVLYILDLRAA